MVIITKKQLISLMHNAYMSGYYNDSTVTRKSIKNDMEELLDSKFPSIDPSFPALEKVAGNYPGVVDMVKEGAEVITDLLLEIEASRKAAHDRKTLCTKLASQAFSRFVRDGKVLELLFKALKCKSFAYENAGKMVLINLETTSELDGSSNVTVPTLQSVMENLHNEN